MNIHIIAVGGSVMHNIALALDKAGHKVSGSDDAIFPPASIRLEKKGLLPDPGWFPEKISGNLDLVILGMHAKGDNPELQMAIELDLKILSFPEFVFEHSRSKKRIVIAGSHGKTTTTAMCMHGFIKLGLDFDYLVGSEVPGFDLSVKLTEDAKYLIAEGDEYSSSPLDNKPKMYWYQPHIALINGLAWDHANVFPTREHFVRAFSSWVEGMAPGTDVVYPANDEEVAQMLEPYHHINKHPAKAPKASLGESTNLHLAGGDVKLGIVGRHNLANLACAATICELATGTSRDNFYKAMQDFTGAARRLERIKNEHADTIVFRDFAHAPSKVKATVESVKEAYPAHHLIAITELHTFSSLREDFLPTYSGSLDKADTAILIVDKEVLSKKGGSSEINLQMLQSAFSREDLKLCETKETFISTISGISLQVPKVLLLMSSGTMFGLTPQEISDMIG